MPQYTEKNGSVLVFTFKDGLLSKVAHDLKVMVTRFNVTVDPSPLSIKAELDPRSLRVHSAMQDGEENPKALSDSDKEKIASQIQKEVLETDQHGTITFTSRSVERRADGGYNITGDLGLHGTSRSINLETRS